MDGEGRGTVLVTGGACRLGRVIAETLRARGWKVLVHSSREGAGDVTADLREPLGAARLFNAACEAAPDLCAIVNNAGLFAADAAALEAVNHVAPERLTMMLGLRLMEHAPFRGAVVDVLDARILGPAAPDEGPYAASKRALMASMTKAAGNFAPRLRVNAVAPGAVLPPEGFHEKAGETLLERRPAPEDVAAAVAFLLENESITGAVLPVDCGRMEQ